MKLDRRLLGVASVGLIAAGIGLAAYGVATPRYIRPPLPPVHPALPKRDLGAPLVSTRDPSPSAPVSLSVPSLGISSPLGRERGLNPDGTINDAPLSGPDWSLPWWYDGGPSPGQAGSAVLLGHVDSAVGEGHLGVFYRLGDLAPGARITVRLTDGSLTRWTAVSTVLYSDSHFPDSLVYTRTGRPTLRLVTCGGVFNWNTHHYESTVVVTAAEDA